MIRGIMFPTLLHKPIATSTRPNEWHNKSIIASSNEPNFVPPPLILANFPSVESNKKDIKKDLMY